jgi:hypothetical protein
MFQAIHEYLTNLTTRFGSGWNRFWFTPSDAFTVCVLRALVGIVAIYSIFTYSFDLDRLFGPEGMLPAETVVAIQEIDANDEVEGLHYWRFSYLDYVHTVGGLWTAHIAGLAVLLLFTLGCYTRVTSVLALIVVLSYIHRGPMLTSQFEPILAMLMFYLCLAPAGVYCSVDRFLAHRRPKTPSTPEPAWDRPRTSATISIRLMQVHLTVIYAMMAIGKLMGPDWWMGTSVWWLIMSSPGPLVDLQWLREHPLLVNAWTHTIIAFELGFPLFVWNRLARPLMLAIGVVMWSSLALLTGLVTFAVLMIVANLAFISSDELRRLCPFLGERTSGVPTRANEPALARR